MILHVKLHFLPDISATSNLTNSNSHYSLSRI